MRTFWSIAALTAALAGCGPTVSSSAVRTSGEQLAPNRAGVRITTLNVPTGARELGLVQVEGFGTNVEELAPELLRRVADLGGDLARVDEVRVRYELRPVQRTRSFNCGTPRFPRTCLYPTVDFFELQVMTIVGRAYKLEATP